MRTDNPGLRNKLHEIFEVYKQQENSTGESLQRITEKGKNFNLTLSQDQLELLKQALKDAKKFSILCENIDRNIEYSILEEVLYNQVIIQTKF